VENRVAAPRIGRPGAPLIALLSILGITAAWWALALWPVADAGPAWLERTRAACFGSTHSGLPDTGGWILLIGEPIGMLAVLFVGWGQSVKRDLRLVIARPARRLVTAAGIALALGGIALLGARVARGSKLAWSRVSATPGTAVQPDMDAPSVLLTDQHGQLTSFADFRGQTVLLTFAFGHCSTVCPAIVHDLRSIRRTVDRPDVPLVVITLDPWRDTPDRLPSIAAEWGLSSRDRVLSGSVADVGGALDAFGIGRRRNETTGDIEHGETVMILNERGRIAWRLDGDLQPVRQLLRSQPR
jgi:cytochrome oxidase Cu insertion factor (SCO1/SenC/PrrC family)